MTLKLADRWVWDFWFVRDGADYHIFYLQADRTLGNELLRHWNVSVGHAVSQNLRQWTILPDVLAPTHYDPASNEPEPWDSKTTWTGSIIQYNGLWHLFYTGTKQSENGLIQRVGLAESADLIAWTKHSRGVLINASSEWYEHLDLQLWHDQAWRDPWVFQHPQTRNFHAFITARVNYGPSDERGVIAHARSANLLEWEVLPPVTAPGEFGQMEVPQVVQIEGRWYLLFSTNAEHFSAARQARGIAPTNGTHYLVADDVLGPYDYLTDEFMVGDAQSSLYSGKLIQGPDNEWQYMAFRDKDAKGDFIGELIDPLPVTVKMDGRLVVDRRSLEEPETTS